MAYRAGRPIDYGKSNRVFCQHDAHGAHGGERMTAGVGGEGRLAGKGESMPARGMSHVVFCVRDMEKSFAFYQEALGFRVLQDRRQDTITGVFYRVGEH